MLPKLLTSIFGSRNERLLKEYRRTVAKINALEPSLEPLSDDQLRAKADEFKQRIAKGESLDDLLPEAFAVVREGSKRVFKMRHFDVQMLGGMALHNGKIAEMRTGEGKTLTATLPVYLNALTGKGVHLVTVNDYLARRDAEWMGKLYTFLGLTVGINLPQMPREDKQAAYAADITYGTNNEYGFDYLRDNMVYEVRDRVQRGLNFAIVDEVDSILIDEARTPLIISGQAVEAKEAVQIQAENQALASITFQNCFRMYGKLAGMTGTADTEAFEFQSIYGLETVVIPPNRVMLRKDQLALVYKTSIENSELIAQMLTKEGLPHQVLNAKQHAREADIVAQAGRPGMVTIATNMAGRGTDIVLGGNVEKDIQLIEADESLDHAAKEAKIAALKADQQALNAKVKELGGLRIIATERHESRRIDNQLRGRAGRQGDPGSSRFFLSLDDPLMRIFAGDRVRAIMDRLKMPEGEAIEAGIVTRSIESAQRKVEGHNFDMRKQLLEYDDVSNDQRKVIYQQRNEILESTEVAESIANLRKGSLSDVVRTFVPENSLEEQWDLPALEKLLKEEWQLEVDLVKWVEGAQSAEADDVLERVLEAATAAYEAKVESVTREQFAPFERMVLLQSIDLHWREHLAALDYLRQGIHLRGYAQKNPKQEYKREAFELFGQLLDVVKMDVTRKLLTVRIQSQEEAAQAAQAIEDQGERLSNVTYTHPAEDGSVVTETDPATAKQEVPRVGRNDPCPCGSGQKFKNCHGKLA